jgi:hypothetical protein
MKMKKNGKILISILNVFIDKSQLSSAQLSSAQLVFIPLKLQRAIEKKR